MHDSTTTNELTARVEKLAPWQRQWLAAALARDHVQKDGKQRLVAWMVPVPDREPALADLRSFVGAQLPDYMVPHQFIVADALPRATSGKLDRAALGFQAACVGGAQREPQAAASGDEAVLADIWADVLGLEYVGVDENFFELGGDSLLSIRILSRARRAGLAISPEHFFAHPTVAAQARLVDRTQRAAAADAPGGALPLTPISHWFFERIPVDRGHWNQCFEWQLDAAVTPAMLRDALSGVLRHHDALRLQFTNAGDEWQPQIGASDAAAPLTVADVGGLRGAALDEALERLALACNTAIDLARGPMLHATLARTDGGAAHRLLLAVHHLAIDALSWRVLVEDLDTALTQQLAQRPVGLPAPSASFSAWSRQLVAAAQSTPIRQQFDYWQQALTHGDHRLPLDHDHVAAANSCTSAQSIRLQLDAETSAQLGARSMARGGSRLVEALLCALTVSMGLWRGDQALMVDVEGHGREPLSDDLDLSRMVGWCTCVYPFLLQPQGGLQATLDDVGRRFRAIPNGGVGYGLLRYLSADPAVRASMAGARHAQLVFNYLGPLDMSTSHGGSLKQVRERRTHARSAHGQRAYAIEVNAWLEGGQLVIDWQFSTALHRPETIQARVDDFAACLRSIADTQSQREPDRPSARDFPLADLDEAEFARLAGLLGEGGSGER